MQSLDLNDYYYDDETFDYMNDDDVFDYSDTIYTNPPDLEAVLKTCIAPSVQQVCTYFFVVLASCFICRLFWFACKRLLQKGEWLKHWISLICGSIVLVASIGRGIWIIIVLSCFSYGVTIFVAHLESKSLLRSKSMGVIVGVTTIVTNIVCELASDNPNAWNSIRGIQMVIAMKVISLAFDVEADENKEKQQPKTFPSLVPYLGYLLCPASCLHGPWHSYRVYVQSMQKPATGLGQGIVWTMSNTLLALGTLSVSNCLAPLLCTGHCNKWTRAYRDALTVRTSHYFISFLSQAMLAASGMSWDPAVAPNRFLGNIVAKPWTIELPRSLSSLVRNWNLPMHTWLKTYVFSKTQTRLNNYFIAVIFTYLASSLLHGLNYQIYAVLISLGCFAYVEHMLRKKLASIFDACITSAPCRQPCGYSNCNKRYGWWLHSSAWWVLGINILFSLLSVFHLAYLGIMLSANDNGETSFLDSISRWRQLNYFNHWTSAAMFAFYCFI